MPLVQSLLACSTCLRVFCGPVPNMSFLLPLIFSFLSWALCGGCSAAADACMQMTGLHNGLLAWHACKSQEACLCF